MAVVVLAELRQRDGQRQSLSVRVNNSLSSLIGGISEITVKSSVFLNDLVEQETPRGGRARGGEESSDKDEKEDEDELKSDLPPPTKRSKT